MLFGTLFLSPIDIIVKNKEITKIFKVHTITPLDFQRMKGFGYWYEENDDYGLINNFVKEHKIPTNSEISTIEEDTLLNMIRRHSRIRFSFDEYRSRIYPEFVRLNEAFQKRKAGLGSYNLLKFDEQHYLVKNDAAVKLNDDISEIIKKNKNYIENLEDFRRKYSKENYYNVVSTTLLNLSEFLPFVLSRNKVTSTNKISSAVKQSLMKKLNKKKIKWIVKEVEKRKLGVWTIARVQKISKQHAYRVAKKFKSNEPELKKCGRKPRRITDDERKIVIRAYKEIRASAVIIEQYLEEKGICIGHNRIHRILLEAKLAKEEHRKKNRRKWIRYERKHSNSLWHTDWFEYKGRQCIIYIDDASRFIPSYGEFDNANTENTIKVFRQGLRCSIPKQVMSDHGTQFENQFAEELKRVNSKHIKARVKHPQSNGKAERAIQTIKKLWNELGSFNKAAEHYNYKKPHMSLTNGKLRTPYQAFIDKKRKE